MRECVEEGILQGYFDGELSSELMESVASHLASCVVCSQAARELENESLLLSQALEPEFMLSVPTERLRDRIDAAIAGRHAVNPGRLGIVSNAGTTAAVPAVREWLQSVADLFTGSPQRAFGYAGLAAVVLLATIIGLVYFKRASINSSAEVAKENKGIAPVPTASPDRSGVLAVAKPSPERVESSPDSTPVVSRPKRTTKPRSDAANDVAHVKLLPGERSYLKTIAALDTSIRDESNRPMRPALQSEYERNLAMVDRAIAATRSAAKKNPNDPDAADFMFAAYQTKVDFLNQVADARLSNRKH